MQTLKPTRLLSNYALAIALCCGAGQRVYAWQFTADLVAPERGTARFGDAVQWAINAGSSDRAKFARVAIESMAAAYEDEIQGSFGASRDVDASWRSGTGRYIAHLLDIAAEIHARSAVEIITEAHGTVRLVVDGRQVMLTAPRLDLQAQFERRIADLFCDYSECSGRHISLDTPLPRQGIDGTAVHAYRHQAAARGSNADGLQCVFKDKRHTKLKNDACLGLLRELRLLAASFAALKAHGKTIDWADVDITHAGSAGPQKLMFRRDGSFVRVDLPGLLRAPATWREALPWIKANIHGRTVQHVVVLPENLAYLTTTAER